MLKAISDVGTDRSAEFLKSVGIYPASEEQINITMALGSIEASPLQMAAAYASIANDGVYTTPIFFTKVVDSSGNTVLTANQEKTSENSEADSDYVRSFGCENDSRCLRTCQTLRRLSHRSSNATLDLRPVRQPGLLGRTCRKSALCVQHSFKRSLSECVYQLPRSGIHAFTFPRACLGVDSRRFEQSTKSCRSGYRASLEHKKPLGYRQNFTVVPNTTDCRAMQKIVHLLGTQHLLV